MDADLKKKLSLTFNHKAEDILSACGINVNTDNLNNKVVNIVNKIVDKGVEPGSLSMILEKVINVTESLEELLAIALPELSDKIMESIKFGIDIKFITENIDKIPDEGIKRAFIAQKIPTEIIPMLAKKLRDEMGISESPCECESCVAKRKERAKIDKASKSMPMSKMGLA